MHGATIKVIVNEFKWVEDYLFSPIRLHGWKAATLLVHKKVFPRASKCFPAIFGTVDECRKLIQSCNKERWKVSARHGLSCIFFLRLDSSSGPRPNHRWVFEITLGPNSLCTTPMDEWLVRRRDLCLTVLKTHNRQTSMSSGRFEPAIPASEWPQIRALGRQVTGIGLPRNWYI
jgi:hypothetical protein